MKDYDAIAEVHHRVAQSVVSQMVHEITSAGGDTSDIMALVTTVNGALIAALAPSNERDRIADFLAQKTKEDMKRLQPILGALAPAGTA